MKEFAVVCLIKYSLCESHKTTFEYGFSYSIGGIYTYIVQPKTCVAACLHRPAHHSDITEYWL